MTDAAPKRKAKEPASFRSLVPNPRDRSFDRTKHKATAQQNPAQKTDRVDKI